MKIEVNIANIANQPDIEALVNSANANLRLGSGVAGAIHTAAGAEMEEYCRKFSPLALGKSVISPGFKLPNKWVIHTRAANYILDDDAEGVLVMCFKSLWSIATEYKIKSLALPAIGTGVFKFPVALAAEITVESLKSHLDDSVELVRICVVDSKTQFAFWDALDAQDIKYF